MSITRPGGAVGRVGVPQETTIPTAEPTFYANVTIAGGPAPVRAYMEELLPDVLEGRSSREQPVSPWAGFSVEIRSHIGPSGVSTRVTTTPERLVASSNGGVVVLGQSGDTIYVSNLSFVNSSLTTALHGFRTYESRGVQAHTAITGGVFFRF